MPNVYYQPEDFGLLVVGSTELEEGCYSFDTLVVWQHIESGQFYVAHDMGCSCPSPFENFYSIEDLDGPYTWHEATNKVLSYSDHGYSEESRNYANNAVADLVSALLHFR